MNHDKLQRRTQKPQVFLLIYMNKRHGTEHQSRFGYSRTKTNLSDRSGKSSNNGNLTTTLLRNVIYVCFKNLLSSAKSFSAV